MQGSAVLWIRHSLSSTPSLAPWQLGAFGIPERRSQGAGMCPAGVAVPCDKQAVGWRVAVYWPEDSTLHDGEIVGFDNVSLRHHVRYDCGDQEHVALSATRVSCADCFLCMLER